MITIGLTGSIGMGKTTVSRLFGRRGIPVFDADATVHRLYAGPLAAAVEAAFPGTVADGAVDRRQLAAAVVGKPDDLKRLEAIVHPAVRAAEVAFLAEARASGAAVAVLDLPLLYETGRQHDVDVVVVVSAPAAIQRQRVLDRPGMTEEKFAAIGASQWPDADKRAQADFVIDTSGAIEVTDAAVADVLARLSRGKHGNQG